MGVTEYGKYDVKGEIRFERKERSIVPVEVNYFNERFYLICMETETHRRRVYRIDRMRAITEGEVWRGSRAFPKTECACVDIFDMKEQVRLKMRARRNARNARQIRRFLP